MRRSPYRHLVRTRSEASVESLDALPHRDQTEATTLSIDSGLGTTGRVEADAVVADAGVPRLSQQLLVQVGDYNGAGRTGQQRRPGTPSAPDTVSHAARRTSPPTQKAHHSQPPLW
jgi:hypothetical protein